MHLRLNVLIAVITASLGSSAFAAPVAGKATLASAASQTRIVGDGGIWRCDGTSCTGMADEHTALAVAACSAVAAANGRVSAFSAGGTDFGAAELKRCNRHVRNQ